MTVEVYLLQPMAILGGQKNGFPTTGLLAVNDGHYKAPTMGIVSTLKPSRCEIPLGGIVELYLLR